MHQWVASGTLPHCAYAWRADPRWRASAACRAACPTGALATNCTCADRRRGYPPECKTRGAGAAALPEEEL
eukprot:2491630-Prymnesium_polylepis.1